MNFLVTTNYGLFRYRADTKSTELLFYRYGQNLYGISWDCSSIYLSSRTIPTFTSSTLYRCSHQFSMQRKLRLSGVTNLHQLTAGRSQNLYLPITGEDWLAELSSDFKLQRQYFPRESKSVGVKDTLHLNSVLLDQDCKSLYIMGQCNDIESSFVSHMSMDTGEVLETFSINSGFACHNISVSDEIGCFVLCAKKPFLTNKKLQEKYERNELFISRQPMTNLFVIPGYDPFFARGLAVTDTHILFGMCSKYTPPDRKTWYWRLAHLVGEPSRILDRFHRVCDRNETKVVVCKKDFSEYEILDLGSFGAIQELRVYDERDYAHNAEMADFDPVPQLHAVALRHWLDRVFRCFQLVNSLVLRIIRGDWVVSKNSTKL